MMKRTRKQYPSALKAKLVLEVLRETKTITELASEHQIHPNLITKWKQAAVTDLPTLFERSAASDDKAEALEAKVAELYQETGKLTTQVSWLKKNLASSLSPDEQRSLAERGADAEVPIAWQADLLSVSRASLYYEPRPARSTSTACCVSEEIALKHRLDKMYTDYPFLGSRKIARMLATEGFSVGRHTIRRYQQEMGLETQYPRPKTSIPGSGPEHRVYPYLLQGLAIERPNHVWGQAQQSCRRVDITYIRLVNGWMYLVAFLDWHSQYVVAWELSDTLEIDFVIACSEAALQVAVPEIVNSDQGSHFTSERFTRPLIGSGVQVSMDGRGRYIDGRGCYVDNIFTERLWRSVKYEEVYRNEYESPRDAREGLSRYLSFYNKERLHQALGYRTPAQIYYKNAC